MFMGDMMNVLYPYLLQLIQTNENPLLFSIASWTIHQFSDWIFANLDSDQMDTLMNTLLQKMVHSDRKIQNAATCCISVLVENGEDRLERYYDMIIRTICQCFSFYCVSHITQSDSQERNQRSLLCCVGDICSILLDSPDIDINQYADILLPPIISKWNLLGDLDEGLLSILECLYYLISVCYMIPF